MVLEGSCSFSPWVGSSVGGYKFSLFDQAVVLGNSNLNRKNHSGIPAFLWGSVQVDGGPFKNLLGNLIALITYANGLIQIQLLSLGVSKVSDTEFPFSSAQLRCKKIQKNTAIFLKR